jgi:GNAT superfamily N-acetyltransferase
MHLPTGTVDPATIKVVPANEASWEDVQAIFGVRGYTAYCQCQRFKIGPSGWTEPTTAERMLRLEQETHAGYPSAPRTSGLVAYLEGEPVGWCAVEPRSNYPKLPPQRVQWVKRREDPADESVWAVTCFATRAGYRRRGITRVLARATVDFARNRGARALEAYPMITEPGVEITWGETHVGTRSIFEAAGFTEVHRATLRRVVMRIDF